MRRYSQNEMILSEQTIDEQKFSEIPSAALSKFISYFMDFYDEKKGTYPIEGLTKSDIIRGVKIRLKDKPGMEFTGDSMDRELVRDRILQWRKMVGEQSEEEEEEILEGEDFKSALDEFLKMCQKIIDRDYETHNKGVPEDLRTFLIIKPGKKFVKIVSTNKADTQFAAWAFVDKETGNVYKPAGWAKPAAHARANIYDKNSIAKGIGPYGPHYLR